MGSHVFDGCSNIKQIDINNSSLNAISEYAFQNCENLTVKTENINCSITAVGAYAFAGCTSLVMNFGQSGEDCSIEELGNRTFRGTPNLNI
jgi:hypothetical protein